MMIWRLAWLDLFVVVILSLEFKWSHCLQFQQTLLLQAYIAENDFDVVCLCKTFLNSSFENNYDRLKIDGYNLLSSDHPSNG